MTSLRRSGRLGVGVGVVTLVIIAVSIALVWMIDATSSAGSPVAATLWLVSIAGAPLVGLLIAGRRPGHPYGWLLLSLGLAGALLEVTELSALYMLESGTGTRGLALAGAVATQPLWAATVGHVPLLLLLFPDGRLPSPRWRWLARAVVTMTVIGGVASLFIPEQLSVVPVANPIGMREPYATWINATVIGMVVGLFLSMIPAAGSLLLRRRRSTAQQRLQLRWFSWAAGLFVLAFLVTGFAGIDNDVISNSIVAAGFAAVYGAIGVAVLRYRLYDIDRIISRTLGWALVTIVIATVYLGGITLLTAASTRLTGESTVAVAASTLLAAAAFGPVRLRIQSAVDRRFNRARYDAAQTIDTYRMQLRDELDVVSISNHLEAAVVSTLQPRTLSLWLRAPEARP